MKTFTKQFKITRITRLYNSCSGGPRYEVKLENGSESYVAKTGSDYAVGYFISYSWEGRMAMIKYHFTKKGNMIIDDAKLIEE